MNEFIVVSLDESTLYGMFSSKSEAMRWQLEHHMRKETIIIPVKRLIPNKETKSEKN